MGFYGERVFPRLMNVMMDTKESRRIRSQVCAPLSGEVVEIGFGSGLNLPHLPSTVERVLAVDPATLGRKLATKRLAASEAEVSFVGLDGQALPLDGGITDQVVDARGPLVDPQCPPRSRLLRLVHRGVAAA